MAVIMYLKEGKIVAVLRNGDDLKADAKTTDWYIGKGDTFLEAFQDALESCDWNARILQG